MTPHHAYPRLKDIKTKSSEEMGTMSTTTQITTTTVLDIDEWLLGDDGGRGFDVDAIRAEWRDSVQAIASRLTGHELTLAQNGEVFGSYDERGEIRAAMGAFEEDGFWAFVAESADLGSVARRH